MLTVKQVERELKSGVPSIENTVDTLKYGKSHQHVSKIAVCFMPTYAVIQEAISLGADLLICHEGLFYSHHDHSLTKRGDIYQQKQQLIRESGLAILRLHDYIHRYPTDGIMKGMIDLLEWNAYVKEHHEAASVFEVPEQTLSDMIKHFKVKLGLEYVRYIGDLQLPVRKIAILVGNRGSGEHTISLFEEDKVDLAVYGEGPEWETPEYVRDANRLGKDKAVILLGHLESEEPGMVYLAGLLRKKYPDITVEYLPSLSVINIL